MSPFREGYCLCASGEGVCVCVCAWVSVNVSVCAYVCALMQSWQQGTKEGNGGRKKQKKTEEALVDHSGC